MDRDKVFMYRVIHEGFGLGPSNQVRVLDFGCGRGEMSAYLATQGYAAYGCDIQALWIPDEKNLTVEFSVIGQNPYRLPYPDNHFNAVFSTSVFEHVHNKEESLTEIHRVLRSGGVSIHLIPAKWYLPHEPHIRIPLANVLWPNVPRWWIHAWVLFRVLLIPQLRHSWRKMVDDYIAFCKEEINYISNAAYRNMSLRIFGNFGTLNEFYIHHSEGGMARLARKLPFKKVSAWVTSQFRMNLIYQKKQ